MPIACNQTDLSRFFSSHFSSNAVAQSQTSPFSANDQTSTQVTHPGEGAFEPIANRGNLDSEQQASAALLRDQQTEQTDAEDELDIASERLSRSMSAVPQEPVSMSPAALFLSSFTPTPTPLPDSEGQVISGYTLGNIIGYGAFSTVRKAYSTSGGVVAVKIVRRSDILKQDNPSEASRRLKREVAVWSTLSHEHILPLFSVVYTPYADYCFTLYCPAGSLFNILKRDGRPALPQDDAGMMFRQVVRGLRYLHEVAMYVHRDIKLENVLVDEMGVCRIGDFGMACKIGEIDEEDFEQEQVQDTVHAGNGNLHRAVSLTVPPSKMSLRSSLQVHLARHRNSTPSISQPSRYFQPGSLPYAAPEILLPQGSKYPHPAQDIWALGVLLYGLLTGRLPFSDPFEPRLHMKILQGHFEIPPDIGRGAERVLKGCLERTVANRWTIEMVDEVAWGVGWGTEGDVVAPAESDDEFDVYHSSRRFNSASRSRTRTEDSFAPSPSWQQEERRAKPSLETASRRSSSRIQRSLSRAPVSASHSSPRRNVISRSKSRHSRAPSPSLNALNSAILSPGPISESSSRSSNFPDSALIVSPPPSLERGRRRKKAYERSPSRSPSPSNVPSTPTDWGSRSGMLDIADGRSEDLHEREASRGRRKYSRNSYSSRPDLFSGTGDAAPELDVLDETSDWPAAHLVGPLPSAPPIIGIKHQDSEQRLLASPLKDHESYGHWRAGRSHSKSCVGHAAEGRQPKTRRERTPPSPLVSPWPLGKRSGGLNHSKPATPRVEHVVGNPQFVFEGRSKSLEFDRRVYEAKSR